MKKKTNKIKKSNSDVAYLLHSDINFECIYPDENPEDSIDTITRTMNHISLFDGIKFGNK